MKRNRINKLSFDKNSRLIIWTIVTVGLSLTALLSFHLLRKAKLDEKERFDYQTSVIIQQIKNRFDHYEGALIQTRAFFLSLPEVSRDDFQDYFNNTQLLQRYPGIQGLGFTAVITPANLNQHIRNVQRTFKDYRLWPVGTRNLYTSILYLEPQNWRNNKAIGFDMFTESTRREAMERARDTGEAILSGNLRLVQETGKEKQPGFIFYLPYYKKGIPLDTVEQRRKAILGYINSPFRSRDLFEEIFKKLPRDIDFQIYDENISQENLLFDLKTSQQVNAEGIVSSEILLIGGRKFVINFKSMSEFHDRLSSIPSMVTLFVGIMTTALLVGIFQLLRKNSLEVTKTSKLIENERENFRNLFRQTPEMVCILKGPEHVFEFVNDAHMKALGFDATGKNVREAQPESVEVHGILDEVYRTGKTADLHELPVTLTNRLRYFNLTYSARKDEKGVINGVMILGTEVTQEVLNREEIRKSRERLSLAANYAHLGFYDWDIPNNIIIFSEQMIKDWGIDPASTALTLEEVFKSVHPDDRERVNFLIQRSILEKVPYDVEYRVIRPDGKIVWFEVHGKVSYDQNNFPVRFFGTCLDITERKKNESILQEFNEKIERERAKYEEVFDKSPAAIAVLGGKDLIFEMTNPAYVKLIGGRNVIGKPVREALPELNGQPFFDMLDSVMKTGVPISMKDSPAQLLDKDGNISERYVDLVYQRIEEHGKVHGIFVQSIDTTAKVLARRSLEESEARLRTYMESMPQMAFVAATNGDVVYFNRRHYEYFGVTEKEHEGWGWKDTQPAVHPEDMERTVETWTRCLKSGDMYEIEYRLKRRDGSYRWHLGRAIPIRDSKGNILQWFGTNTEIHEQKELLEELKASENRLKLALEAGQMGTWIVNLKTSAVELSEESRRLFGLREDSTNVDETIQTVIHPEDRKKAKEDLEKAIAENSVYHSEYRIVRQNDGAQRWILATGRGKNVGNGDPNFFSGVIVDITDRKIAEEKLSEKTAFLETVLEQMPVASFFAEAPTGKLLFTNRKFNEVWKNPPKNTGSIDEYSAYKAYHPDGKIYEPQDWPLSRSLLYGEVITNEDTDVELFDGARAIIRLNAAPIRNKKGDIIAGVVLSEDVTARIATQRELQEAVKARDEFLSIASHELKTPLTSLKLQLHIFKKKSSRNDHSIYDKTQVDDMVNQTDRQIDRVNRLVDDMLDIARIRSGKLSIKQEVFDLCELTQDVLARMKNQFREKHNSLPELQLCDSAVGNWDKLRIEQVLNNLFTNAIRYGEGKPIKVSVVSRKDRVLLSVTDQGIGIAEENKQKIFDRFERAVNASEVSGLGLGLFITKQIVAAHNGKIWVKSELGKGSTFFVELPTL